MRNLLYLFMALVMTSCSNSANTDIAEEVEHLCHLYIEAKKIGEPNLLSKKQMSDVIERFQTYSRWTKN